MIEPVPDPPEFFTLMVNNVPVALVDERWTTELAQSQLDRERRGREGRSERDEIAAQLILQAYFDEQSGTARNP